jgi:hypothetical protein
MASKLERELKKALEPAEPPDGFAERVMARVAAGEREKGVGGDSSWWKGLFESRGLRWALTGALCVSIAAGGIFYRHEQDRRAAGEQAKEQLMMALRLTASKLQLAQSEVQQINSGN